MGAERPRREDVAAAAARRRRRPAAPAPARKHVGGIGLGLKAIWSIVASLFRTLFGRGKPA